MKLSDGGGTVTGPVLEPGMPGYGGHPSGSPSLPGFPGVVVRQGGYLDPQGVSHPFNDNPAIHQAVFGTPSAAPSAPAHTSSPFDSDPGYQAALAQEHSGIGSLNNDLQNLIAKRIVAYGDPSLAAMAGFGLDPQSAAFARQNYLSGNAELARLDKSHTQARQQVINALAGHGLIFSGDTGYQLGNADQSYGNQVYDAQQQALADILGYRQQTQQQETALHNQVIQALENAFNNYSSNPAAYGQIPEAPQPKPPPTSVTPPKPPKAPTAPARKPSSNKAALRALSIRSAALNKLYGL